MSSTSSRFTLLATAPTAHADDPFTEMLGSVQATITHGENLLDVGAESFAAGG